MSTPKSQFWLASLSQKLTLRQVNRLNTSNTSRENAQQTETPLFASTKVSNRELI